jgi:two-component system sensor histidine kinase YesM
MKRNIKELMEENINKEKKKRNAELNALQAQISPHFLFNTLNSVRWAIINKNNDKAENMVLSLVKLLRMTINKQGEEISIAEEIDNIKNYIAIIKMRHGMNFEISYEIRDDLENYRVPRLLLQPIIENSIIHGFQGVSEGGYITVKVRKEERVLITICDNGNGFNYKEKNLSESKNLRFSGIGIKNVEERIKLNYGDDYGVLFKSEQGKGTKVILCLPKPKE